MWNQGNQYYFATLNSKIASTTDFVGFVKFLFSFFAIPLYLIEPDPGQYKMV